MNNLQTLINEYIKFCKTQKRLDHKTINAYRIDLTQFTDLSQLLTIDQITITTLEDYISHLHENYKPRTAKRKIASVKAFFRYLEYKELIENNPFHKLHTKFREPSVLPKTIPLHTVETFLAMLYHQHATANTPYQRRNALRDIAVIELLFSTGLRISELCSLKNRDVNLLDGTIFIYGKGAKERYMHIGHEKVLSILYEYKREFEKEIQTSKHFFVNQTGRPLSDQTVRRMINKYTDLAAIELHITPHMFRHTFATCLLEEGVDIRYIQEMLGHSSINITEIYTHVATRKTKEILVSKHPRRNFDVEQLTLSRSPH